MVATIQIHEMTALASGTDKTSGTIRMKAADNQTVDANNPLVIPSGADIYSYSKYVRAYMEAPPDTNVSNLRWYMDGSNDFGTGVTMQGKNTGTTFSANVNTQLGGTADLFSYTSGSPLDGDGTDTGPFVPGDDDSYIGDLIQFQMTIANTASNGSLSGEDLTLAYDEI